LASFFDEIPERLLMGPGPSPVPASIRLAMASPVLGHLDPAFLAIMDRVSEDLRFVFGTANRLTLPLSGTGSAGMEAAVANWVEPGDSVLVVTAGLFGQRLADAASRQGGRVDVLEVPWGQALDPGLLEERLRSASTPYRLVALVMAETSTGVLQPMDGLADIVHAQGALFVVDAVTAIGGMPVDVDRRGLDVVFAGSQKCLAVPPGLAPITAGDAALERLRARTAPPPSWYLDLSMLERYWGGERFYHHTAPISMIYGLAEGLRLVRQEGLSARFARHRRANQAMAAGMEAMGLSLGVEAEIRLPSLITVRIPEGVEDAAVRRRLLEEFNIEIGGGLGPLKGQIWRIGTMGEGARLEPVVRVLAGLGAILRRPGGAEAATEAWESFS
jgi:alanine-glyoxylate transaminase/serine-glyoxylate transaminase/serine-pyruvate transaminase